MYIDQRFVIAPISCVLVDVDVNLVCDNTDLIHEWSGRRELMRQFMGTIAAVVNHEDELLLLQP